MHVTIEKASVWLGLAMIGTFLVIFCFIAGFIPPMAPSSSAQDVARFYGENHTRISIGMTLMILVSFLFCPFFAVLSRQVRRIEGYWGALSLTQIFCSVTFPFGFAICAIFAAAAAYRPDRDPASIQTLNDVFWFFFIGLVSPLITQVVILALAVFIDKRAVPSFPRWFGYFNIWYAILGVPGAAIYCFQTGPLAWNGMFAFWVPLTVYMVWMVVVAIMLIKAIDIEAAERAENAANLTWEPAA